MAIGAPYLVFFSRVQDSGNGQNVTVTKPVGLAIDDIWIVALSSSRQQAFSFPSGIGWTQAATSDTASGAVEHGEIWWKRATSADVAVANYSVNIASGATDWTYSSLAYRNCATSGTPMGTVYTTADWTSDKIKIAPGANSAISTGLYDTTTVGIVLYAGNAGGLSLGPTSRGWEERGGISRTGSATYVADSSHPIPSDLDDDLYDLTVDSGNNAQATGFAFALKPATPLTTSASPRVSWWGGIENSTATTITPTMRSSHVASGDLLLANISMSADRSASLVSNHGYDKVTEVVDASAGLYHSVWKKIAGSSEPNPTWSYTSSGPASSAGLFRVRSFDTTTPIQAVGAHYVSPTGTTNNQISVSGADAGAMRTNLAQLTFAASSVVGGFTDRLPETADVYANYNYGAAREAGQSTLGPATGTYWRTYPGPGISKLDYLLTATRVNGKVSGVQLLINSGYVASGEPGRAGFLGD